MTNEQKNFANHAPRFRSKDFPAWCKVKLAHMPEETRKIVAFGCICCAAVVLVITLGFGTRLRLPEIAGESAANDQQAAFPLPEPATLPSPIASMLASLQEVGKLARPSTIPNTAGLRRLISPLRAVTRMSVEGMTRVGDVIMRLPGRMAR